MATKPFAAAVALLLGCTDPTPLRIAVVEGSGTPYAAELAAEDINAAGGINGRLLEIAVIPEPEDVTPQQAIATADSLSRDPSILAVVGHGGSATSLAASQVYNAQRVPQLAPTTSSPLYTEAGPYSFRMVASDEHQAEFIARHIEANAMGRPVAILYVNDDYGLALRNFLGGSLRRRGIEPVYEAPFIAGRGFERSAGELVASIRAANPELLVWIGLTPELLVLRPQLRRVLPRLRVLGSDGVSFIGATTALAPFEGDWLVALSDVQAERPALRSVAERFQPLTGRALTDAGALTYDAVGVLAEAMRSGARTRTDIQRFLEEGGASGRAYDGITGPIVLDLNGDARPSYVLLEIGLDGSRVVTR
jgi:branched-chain amino acid transport system substrate-binding protein